MRSQTGWEKGLASPDAQVLVAWSDAGADVGYILTGTRSVGQRLASDEAELVLAYRRSSADTRAASLRVLEAGGSYADAPSAQIAGDVGQVVQGDANADRINIRVGSAKKGGEE